MTVGLGHESLQDSRWNVRAFPDLETRKEKTFLSALLYKIIVDFVTRYKSFTARGISEMSDEIAPAQIREGPSEWK